MKMQLDVKKETFKSQIVFKFAFKNNLERYAFIQTHTHIYYKKYRFY